MRDPIHATRSRARIAADNRDELESWIAERAEALVATGMDREAARRQAIAEFGNADDAEAYAVAEDAAADRVTRIRLWFEEFASDMRIAARTLARTPTVTAVVLLTFALGVGATTAVYSVVHAMLIRPLPFGNEESLVWIPAVDNGVIRPGLGGARHSALGIEAIRARTTSFSGVTSVSMGNFILDEANELEQLSGAMLPGSAFGVLQARPSIGRAFTAEESAESPRAVVVLLDALWRRRFRGDSAIVGRSITLDGTRREVIGVMPPAFRVPTYEGAEFIVPQEPSRFLANPNSAQTRVFRVFARLRDATPLGVAQADIDRVMAGLQQEHPRTQVNVEARVVPLRGALAGGSRARLLVLMGAAVFVLLIGCANVAGILLSRALGRRHELSVRVALGAGRRRLARQFLAEGAVLAVAGAALGILFAQLGISGLRQLATDALPQGTTFALEPVVVAFAVGVAMLAALAASVVPALGATRVPGVALRSSDGRASAGRGARGLRLALVAGQLAVSVVLLVGAGLFLQTLQRLSTIDLGYSTENALTFRPSFTRPHSNAEQDAFYASLFEQLKAIPGVKAVGAGNLALTGNASVNGIEIDGRSPEGGRLPDARVTYASDDYFTTLGQPMISGRTFDEQDRDGVPWVAVVSESFAKRQWPDGDMLGARVRVSPTKPWATVVGVVGDVRMGAADSAMPSVYTSLRQDHWPGAAQVIVRTSGEPQAAFASIRAVVRSVEPGLVLVGLRTLDDFRRTSPAVAERRLQMQLMLAFALAALVVAATGVYGVSAYATQARHREFGIRMALGASRGGVLRLALGEAVTIGVAGALIGGPAALALAWAIRSMLYAVAPFDLPTLAAALGVLLLVVLVASFVPAQRATRIDPAGTMRAD